MNKPSIPTPSPSPSPEPVDDAEQARRSDLCGALMLEATAMLDLAEAAGYALKITIDVMTPPVQIVIVGPPPSAPPPSVG